MKKGTLVAFHGADRPLELQRRPLRPLRPGEILVRNLYTTLCGSDLHTFCGVRNETCPTVLGHEIVGRVVEVDAAHPGTDLRGETLIPGDTVTWSIFSSDPASPYALQGIPQKGEGLFKYGHSLLEEEDAFHGGLAEYCFLRPHTAVLKVPSTMPLPVAATLNCAIATVAGSLRLAGDLKGKKVLIFGMGLLGMACAAMSRDAGADWIGAADVNEKRLEESLLFGADITLDMKDDRETLPEKLRAGLPQNGVDIVFDMSGSPDAMELGLDVLGIGGTAVWVGAVFRNRKLAIDAEKVIRRLHTIRGLHNYNFDDFMYALDFMKRNWEKYPFGSVVEKEFPLEEAQQAFEYAVKYKPLRVGISI